MNSLQHQWGHRGHREHSTQCESHSCCIAVCLLTQMTGQMLQHQILHCPAHSSLRPPLCGVCWRGPCLSPHTMVHTVPISCLTVLGWRGPCMWGSQLESRQYLVVSLQEKRSICNCRILSVNHILCCFKRWSTNNAGNSGSDPMTMRDAPPKSSPLTMNFLVPCSECWQAIAKCLLTHAFVCQVSNRDRREKIAAW